MTGYSGSGLMNLTARAIDTELLHIFGLNSLQGRFSPVVGSSSVCAMINADAARQCGMPVAAGMFDIDACAIAMNIVDSERIAVIAGTWSINEYFRPELNTSGAVKMNSLCWWCYTI